MLPSGNTFPRYTLRDEIEETRVLGLPILWKMLKASLATRKSNLPSKEQSRLLKNNVETRKREKGSGNRETTKERGIRGEAKTGKRGKA